ncbi:MAG: scyllo-inositol 2-dehydrogenase (NAD(+)) [Steroidobacteraceae bacterium]|nr:scyllo-inositol 2-dehydrogenase (NAD(+)) [Steroidobacteraceae bacterium]
MGRRHAAAIHSDPETALVALVDADGGARSESLASEHGVPLYCHVLEMIERQRPDGVIVATPTGTHVEVGIDCIKAGLPSLVEKPIADTVEGALVLADLAEQSGVPVLVGHHRRHNPITQRARALIRAGEIGELNAIAAIWFVHKPDSYFDVLWRRKKGAGPILTNLIHDIDSLRYIAGELECVSGMVSSERRSFEVEDTAVGLLKFKSGALGTIAASDASVSPWAWDLSSGEVTSYVFPQSHQDCYRLTGSAGALAIPSLRIWRSRGDDGWREPLVQERIPVEKGDPYEAQLTHFVAVIRGLEQPVCGPRDAARTLEATLAIARSAELQRPVYLVA